MEDRLFDLESNLDKLNVKLIQMAWKIDDVDRKISEAPSIDIQDEVYDFRGNLLSLEKSLFSLRMRIGELEERVTAEQRKLPTLPDTNLISESLWQRMWAVFGHGLLGNIALTAWIIAIILLLTGGD